MGVAPTAPPSSYTGSTCSSFNPAGYVYTVARAVAGSACSLLLPLSYTLYTGDRPGILKLKKIKAPDGLSIIESIAAKDFKTFGMYLLNDDNGQKVKMVQKSNVTEELPGVVEAIINAWLDMRH